jgi:hypothetical protein
MELQNQTKNTCKKYKIYLRQHNFSLEWKFDILGKYSNEYMFRTYMVKKVKKVKKVKIKQNFYDFIHCIKL